MSNLAFATQKSDGSTIQFNLDQVITVSNPQVLGGPNTINFSDGTNVIIVERYQDIGGAAT